MNALTLIFTSLCVFAIGYRFYGLFIARRVMALNDDRPTPAVTLADGHDYVKTDKYVLFGHHFAAIAAAGPLLGPVLAAQFGFLPGASGSLSAPLSPVRFTTPSSSSPRYATRGRAYRPSPGPKSATSPVKSPPSPFSSS